jgi:NAD(P)-dependent dehydrogenase (short-subunit alcohol dehydrogenase family)
MPSAISSGHDGVTMTTHAGRHVLVTGGTSGIGAGIARAFQSAGARVLVTGLTAAEADAARADGLDASPLDVSDDAAVSAFAGRLERQLSTLDALVNCAGMIRRRDEHEVDVFAQVVDVNLTGTMRMCAACRPLLAKQGGAIVNTASMYSFFGAGHAPGYGASKGGVAQLTKALAVAYAPQKIRVNAVAPGWIRTAITQPVYSDPARSQPILDRTPLGRWGEPEDVAGPVLFLCSPAAAFVTGVILPVDGGYLVG